MCTVYVCRINHELLQVSIYYSAELVENLGSRLGAREELEKRRVKWKRREEKK